jgi:predicted nucleic acid-binding protein
VLAITLGANASLIVPGDGDLLVLRTFRDIRILNATDALAAMGR